MKTPSRLAARVAFLSAGLLLASASAQTAAPVVPKFNGATPLEWSQRLADSEMKRLGTAYEAGGSNPLGLLARCHGARPRPPRRGDEEPGLP